MPVSYWWNARRIVDPRITELCLSCYRYSMTPGAVVNGPPYSANHHTLRLQMLDCIDEGKVRTAQCLAI